MNHSKLKLGTFIHNSMCIFLFFFLTIHLCPALMKSIYPITVIEPQRAFIVNDDNVQEIIKT